MFYFVLFELQIDHNLDRCRMQLLHGRWDVEKGIASIIKEREL